MAGMICLPQLLAHHRNIAVGSDGSDTLKFIERRLLKSIINPAMILAWIAGPYLAWAGDWWTTPRFQIKFALVLALRRARRVLAVGQGLRRGQASDEPRCSALRQRASDRDPDRGRGAGRRQTFLMRFSLS